MTYIGIDIGGSNVRVATTEYLMSPKIEDRLVIPNNHDFEDYIKVVTQYIRDRKRVVKGIGISVTSDLNSEKTMAIDASVNAPELLNKPIVKMLSDEFKCKVIMENDGTAMALGEATFGRKDVSEFIYLIWGTGIGGAKVVRYEKRINVEQIDWYKYFEDWEYECGGEAIRKIFNKLASELSVAEWNSIMRNFERRILEFSMNYPTGLLVFGGGIALHKFELLKNLKKKLQSKIPEVSLTKFGDDTGIYGAFALLM